MQHQVSNAQRRLIVAIYSNITDEVSLNKGRKLNISTLFSIIGIEGLRDSIVDSPHTPALVGTNRHIEYKVYKEKHDRRYALV